MSTFTPEQDRLAKLLARTALRDHAAFEQVYTLTKNHLFGVALRILRRHERAEEILQDAFVNVWLHAGSYSATLNSPMTWLISIVRNKCFDYLRQVRNSETVSSDEDVEHIESHDEGRSDPAELLSAATDRHILGQCMSTLAGRQRQSLALAFYDGMSHAELANHFDAPLGTVKAWVRRGMDRLKRCIQGGVEAAEGEPA